MSDHKGIYNQRHEENKDRRERLSDEYAQKVAKLELSTMSALLSLPENPFRLTLSMCVEYGGHCIMCTAKAPLAKGDGQFMYGSSNAGKKYYVRDKEVAKLMEELGRNFHLGSHTVFPRELVTKSNDDDDDDDDR